MKNTILSITYFLICSTTFGQVPNWLKNAQPLTDQEIALIEKKGPKMVKAYKDYPEDSDEKQITYRINNIPYLKKLEKLRYDLTTLPGGSKPKAFPLYLSRFLNTKAQTIESKNISPQKKEIAFLNDTIVDVVDVIFPLEYYTERTFTPLNNKVRLPGMSLVIIDKNNVLYQLKKVYYDIEQNYPDFADWLYKYKLYGDTLYEKDNAKNTTTKNEIALSVTCNSSIDDFTNEKITITNQRSLITIKSDLIIDRSEELEKQGYYIDAEDFVFAITGRKIGKNKMLDIYLSIGKKSFNDYYGILKEGSTIQFKLDNGKVVKLPYIKTSSPELKSNNVQIFYRNTLLVTDNDVSEFLNSNIRKIRIHYSEGYRDYEVSENNDLLKKIMECIK